MEFYERYPEEILIVFHYIKSLTLKEMKSMGVLTGPNEEERKKYYRIIMNFCDGIIKCNGEVKRLYKFTGGNIWGETNNGSGRLFCGNSIQGIQRDIRGLVVRGYTTDMDMANAHPVILRYICKIHNVPCPNLEYYINNRDEILSRFETREKGKLLFLKSTNNDKLNKKERDEFFKAYDTEMKVIQKSITMKDEYKRIVEDVDSSKLYNWYGSAINRILCYFENKILQIIIDELNRRNIEILAPMFDGAILYGIHTDDLLRKIESIIETAFPNLNMKLTIKDHSTLFQVPDDFEVLTNGIDDDASIATDDNEASNILFEKLKDNIKSYKGRLFYKDVNIWISDRNRIDDLIFDYIMDKSKIYKGYDEERQKPIPYAQNVSSAKRLREALYSKIIVNNEDYELYNKFHSTMKGKICFQDGVLDFINKSFTLWCDIKANVLYPTIMINRNYGDYFNTPNREVINNIKDKIYKKLYGDKTDKALHFLSRALAGHNEDKVWGSYLGNRNCGKSLEFDLEKAGFGDYVGSFELSNMLYCRKTAGIDNQDSRRLYWTMDLEWIRLSVSQEVPEHKSGLIINGKILKKISGGGDEMTARRNFDRIDSHFHTQATLFIKGNSDLICDTPDCNETRVQFSSIIQFKTKEEIEEMKKQPEIFTEAEMKRYEIKDYIIKEKCKTIDYANAVVYLIYENYKSYPVHIENDVEVQGNDLLKNIYTLYEITNNKGDIITIEYVNSSLNDFDRGKISNELTNLGVIKKKATKGELKGKTCYFGIKEKLSTAELKFEK